MIDDGVGLPPCDRGIGRSGSGWSRARRIASARRPGSREVCGRHRRWRPGRDPRTVRDGLPPCSFVPTRRNSPFGPMPGRKWVMSECGLILLACRQPFNHGVEGSSPSALTREIKHLAGFRGSARTACVGTVLANPLPGFVKAPCSVSHSALCESGIRRVLCSETYEPVSAFESLSEKAEGRSANSGLP